MGNLKFEVKRLLFQRRVNSSSQVNRPTWEFWLGFETLACFRDRRCTDFYSDRENENLHTRPRSDRVFFRMKFEFWVELARLREREEREESEERKREKKRNGGASNDRCKNIFNIILPREPLLQKWHPVYIRAKSTLEYLGGK